MTHAPRILVLHLMRYNAQGKLFNEIHINQTVHVKVGLSCLCRRDLAR